MANVISELPKISRKGAGGRRGSKYPLDEWFDGQVRELSWGTEEQFKAGEADFAAKTGSIVNMLHTQAAGRKLKLRSVRIETDGDKDHENVAVVVVARIEDSPNGATEEPKEEKKGKK